MPAAGQWTIRAIDAQHQFGARGQGGLDLDRIEAVDGNAQSIVAQSPYEAAVLSRTFLRDFVDFLGPDYRISKIMPYGLEPLAWTVKSERFRYGNYLAQPVV